MPQKSRESLRFTVILLAVGFPIFLLIYFLSLSSPMLDLRPTVAIYAAPRFHQEVISVLACAYHALGYQVHIYLTSGIFIYWWKIPYTDHHLYESKDHYGKCVDRWININDPSMKLSDNTSILIYGTYPLRVKGGLRDEKAFRLLKLFALQIKPASRVIYVTHHSHEIVNEDSTYLETIVPRTQSVYLFLANHTETHAKNNYVKGMDYQTAHFYPVLPMNYLIEDNVYEETSTHPDFSVQGNFGGRHAHRKNTEGVINCIRRLEELSPNDKFGLDFIGSGNLKQHSLKQGVLRHLSDLSHKEFYRAIAITKFLVPAIGEDDYYFSRATSSVPAALISHVPIATSRSFLMLYPCLRDQPLHKLITQDSECETMMAASELSEEQYLLIKKEAVYCAESYWNQSLSTLRRIAQ